MTPSGESPVDTPVVNVGAGPAGATAALLLAARGIPSVILDRRTTPLFHPAAHVVNARTLKIWHQYSPNLAANIVALSPAHEAVNLISWYGALADPVIGSIDLLSDPERKAHIHGSALVAADAAQRPTEDVVDYRSTTYPGARLPHARVVVDGKTILVHDVIEMTALTLFTFAGGRWQRLLAHSVVPSPGIVVVPLVPVAEEDRSSLVERFQVGESGAVLVRPDGHVVWRTSSPAEIATSQMLDTVRQGWGGSTPDHAGVEQCSSSAADSPLIRGVAYGTVRTRGGHAVR
ncbi:FAD-dependent monooxygenase [Rhodococcus qingshengii]|uniref:aromatic-ring hydroxylase C-terminal domain-containing protein n=1 Tax=Rhodococcus qingshengii TaxID=334542 RepID=UPI00237C9B7E|nr:FAD-dependent monooxygenase [Rhodococcus qingshengii]WCT05761.1 FAD-dependent monooxygenase [Rhodococcus qingshengii]